MTDRNEEISRLRENMLADLRSFQVDEAVIDSDTLINIDFLVTDLVDHAEKYAAAAAQAARIDEVQRCQQHVFKLRTSVPRLQQTPPQMDEYYQQRQTELQSTQSPKEEK